jgi:hypothetical protein
MSAKDSTQPLTLRLRIMTCVDEASNPVYSWTNLNDGPDMYGPFAMGSWLVEEAPRWVRESMALLLIVENGTDLNDVGYRMADNVFYLNIKGSLGDQHG